MNIIRKILKRLKDYFEDINYNFCSCKTERRVICSDRELLKNNILKTPYLHHQKCLKPIKPNYSNWFFSSNY